MRLRIEIEKTDVARLKRAFRKWGEHEFVQERIQFNVHDPGRKPDIDRVWTTLALALTTSQQRSSPGTPVWRLWCADPSPLSLEKVKSWSPNIADEAARFLKEWGVNRFYKRIGEFLETNYRVLFDDGVSTSLQRCVDELWTLRAAYPCGDTSVRDEERRICEIVLSLGLKGIGNKQCRNWLQNCRLLRYEIPLDSRLLKFLKPVMPSVPLEQDLLAYASYYHFIEDTVQELCADAGLLPCVADAVMFLNAGQAMD
jgi:hypothetical protein